MAIHYACGTSRNHNHVGSMKRMKGRYMLDRSFRMSVQEEALIRMYEDGELERREYKLCGERKVIYHSKLNPNE